MLGQVSNPMCLFKVLNKLKSNNFAPANSNFRINFLIIFPLSLFMHPQKNWNINLGHNLNGHHLLEFSTSIDNQTSLSLSRLKIRVATLWVMVGASPKAVMASGATYSDDIVQLHHLNHKQGRNHPTNVNTLLLKKSHNQSRRKRKKRKRKDETESDSNLYYFENHSYNHITNDNNNGNHIIKSNRNEKRRRKVKSINLVDSNKLNLTRTTTARTHKNLTLWIFRIKKPMDRDGATNNVDDTVWRIDFQ